MTTAQAEGTGRRRLPAEWEPAGAVLLAWPRADGDWAPYLEAVRACYRQLLLALSAIVPVLLLTADPEQTEGELGAELTALRRHHPSRLRLLASPANDTWTRDYGPITVMVGQGGGEHPLLLDFRFNGWGSKFSSTGDDAACEALQASGALGPTPLQRLPLVLEGGSIDSDGQGSLLTTRQCLLAPSRNPQLNQQQLEQQLRKLLGAERVLWLDQAALAGDDTDAHIDTLVRFCPGETLVYASGGPAAAALEQQLRALTTCSGRPYRLVALPPGPSRQAPDDGRPLPATYANALLLNGTVLVPTYGEPARDAAALQAWGEACPGWSTVPINCSALLLQHGSLHCATMQIPAAVFR